MKRLRKADVVTMMSAYDLDPAGALTRALQRVLESTAAWPEILARAGLDPERRQLLEANDQAAMDGLLTELNERRQLG